MYTRRITHTETGIILIGTCVALMFAFPHLVGAHNGVVHSTEAEAQEHLHHSGGMMDATCMATAVDARESALMSAWSELNSSLTTSLTERKTALVAAWNLSSVSERTKALVAAWKEWRADKKAAQGEFRKDRKAAWDTFKKTAKDSCKSVVPKDEAMEKAEKDSVAL